MITILETLGPALAKRWKADGTIQNYDDAKHYHYRPADVSSLPGLAAVLARLQQSPRKCVIRGAPRNEFSPDEVTTRDLDRFFDAPSHLFMVDVDNWCADLRLQPSDVAPAAARFVEQCLPAEFQDVSYVLQLSGSMGHPTKSGLRAHLWFWLAEPITCAQAEAWAKAYIPAADHTVHRTVQPNFTADPVLADGLVDPFDGARLTFVQGPFGDVVELDLDAHPMPAARAQAARTERAEIHGEHPHEKRGVIGAVCRAYAPTDVCTLFPDLFVEGSRPERITWTAGGGSAEGVGVAETGLHLFNTHASSPIGARRVNVFDFIRAHVFGHLDADVDPDALELDPTGAPSYRATEEWARAQPEVQAQLNPTTPAQRAEVAQTVGEARALTATKAEKDAPSRTERLDNLILNLQRCPDLNSLEKRAREIAAKVDSLTDAERDMLATRTQQLTRPFNGGKPIQLRIIRDWFLPPLPAGIAFPDLDPDGRPVSTIDNLQVLLGQLQATVRYDVIRKDQVILAPGMSYTRELWANASLAWLTSEANKAGCRFKDTHLKAFLCEISGRNQHNPVAEWINAVPWDGRSRVDELMATIDLEPGFDPPLARMIVRKWLIQAVAAACSPSPLQVRGVLVFTGQQYAGKSRWLQALAGGQPDLVISGRTLDPHKADHVKQAISHWICELGELDGTLKKADAAALKAFLANDEDVLRLPYAPLENKYQRRTVFCATVNGAEFLIDDTGNTRFWVLPIRGLDPDHKVDMQQLWAEVYSDWSLGEAHWFEKDEMARVTRSNERFEVADEVFEAIAERFPWSEGRRSWESGVETEGSVQWGWLSNSAITRLAGIVKTGRDTQTRVGIALAKLSPRPSRSQDGVRLRLVPLSAEEAETLDGFRRVSVAELKSQC